MAATIPATNKWLLTKQASVAQSAEQWQARGSAVQRRGGLPDSSASRVAGGPRWHISRWRWLGKEKGGCSSTKKKKRWRQEESEKKMMSEPLGKAGDPGEYKCANSSEMPLNVCTVIQMSGCFYHHCVFTHRAGCQPHSLGDSNTKARAWDALVPGPSLLRRDIHWYSI